MIVSFQENAWVERKGFKYGVSKMLKDIIVLCDNLSVVRNSSKIESTLNKKHNSIAYHAVRWGVAAGIIRVGKIAGEYNLADAMTKRLTVQRRSTLFGGWTY